MGSENSTEGARVRTVSIQMGGCHNNWEEMRSLTVATPGIPDQWGYHPISPGAHPPKVWTMGARRGCERAGEDFTL